MLMLFQFFRVYPQSTLILACEKYLIVIRLSMDLKEEVDFLTSINICILSFYFNTYNLLYYMVWAIC